MADVFISYKREDQDAGLQGWHARKRELKHFDGESRGAFRRRWGITFEDQERVRRALAACGELGA